MERAAPSSPRDLTPTSRYERLVKIASGGMATVYVGRLRGDLGFEQLVAIKRPHPHIMQLPDFRRGLMAEARLAARMRHANLVGVRDVEAQADSILLVMDYVEGASLHELFSGIADRDRKTMIRVGLRAIRDLCAGLQAVHDLTDDEDRPLGAVHRDVSPQNVLVGIDGVSRLADFGIAKCIYAHETSTTFGTLKGKVSYMAPEYVEGQGFDQRADIFAVGVMLWEILAGRRLFVGENHLVVIRKILLEPIPSPSEVAPELGDAFDAIVERAVARDPAARFERASDLGAALDAALFHSEYAGTHHDVARFVRDRAGPRLLERRQRIKDGLRAVSTPDATASLASPAEAASPLPLSAPPVSRPQLSPPQLSLGLAVSTGETVHLPESRRPRPRTTLVLATSAVVAAVGVLIGTGVLGPRANPAPAGALSMQAPDAPIVTLHTDPVVPVATTVAPIASVATTPVPAPVRASASAPNPNAKAADKGEKPAKPTRTPPPLLPSAPPSSTTPAVPPLPAATTSDVPPLRGNPY
ncbi:protein kinase domain-containing protein [Pendulispora albinea]|uniref:Protein kinase n=1 Tax=Pendulispora albinea TaxID=2741071 RepID=A0ABZ2LMC5_9BACT